MAAWEAEVGSQQPKILGQPRQHSKTPSEKKKHYLYFSSVKISVETYTHLCLLLVQQWPAKYNTASVKEVRIFDEY